MLINQIFELFNGIRRNPLIFISPHMYSIGNCSEEIFFGLMKARHEQKKLFLLESYDITFLFGKNVCNQALFRLESEYIYKQGKSINHLSKLLVTLMILPIRLVDRGVEFLRGHSLSEKRVVPLVGRNELWSSKKQLVNGFSWDNVNVEEWTQKIHANYDVFISSIDNVYGKRCLYNIGVKETSWYVCLHVRESGFRNDKGRREYRNSDIKNYIPAIKKITNAGGLIVRMGDSTMKRLPEMENVIDYPFSGYQTAAMDIYLIANCKFFIGTHSGILDTAMLLGKDVLMTNMVGWTFAYPLRRRDRGIHKHIYSIKDERFLTFKEILGCGWESQNLFGHIDDNYRLVENTSEDILAAVSEYIEAQCNDDFDLDRRQVMVNRERIKKSRMILEKNRITSYDEYAEASVKYRIASRIEASVGSLSSCYLKKYLHSIGR